MVMLGNLNIEDGSRNLDGHARKWFKELVL
jgi:hypothetical protein